VGEAVRDRRAGDELEITIERDGEERDITATLGRRGG
jgi:S1-C subfamily serine protease